jgi:hypothetical protein
VLVPPLRSYPATLFNAVPSLLLFLLCRDPTVIVLAPGGLSAAGILGQVSGALELVGQIQEGVTEDPDFIVLAVGSSCTLVDLIVGVTLSRALGLQVFRKPGFHLVGVPMDHALGFLERQFGFFKSWVQIVACTPSYTLRQKYVIHTHAHTCTQRVDTHCIHTNAHAHTHTHTHTHTHSLLH